VNLAKLAFGRTAKTGAALAVAAGLALGLSGTAHAASALTLQNQNTGRCVDDSYAYGLRAFGCNGMSYQKFWFYGQSDGSYVLQNQNTGRCVDDSFDYGLRAFGCNGMNYQKWRITYRSDGSWSLVNENTGRSMDDSYDYGLRSWWVNDMNYQNFWAY
jgi:hypothetical protein